MERLFNFADNDLVFDEEEHKFSVDGERLLSVTQVLSGAGCIDTKFFTDQGRKNGTRRHLVTELYDKGILDEATVDPADRPYLDAWIKAKEEWKIQIVRIETQMYHPLLRYAGIVDRLCLVDGVPTVCSAPPPPT